MSTILGQGAAGQGIIERMCGRFVLFNPELMNQVGELPGMGEVHAPLGLPPARYNIAPTTPIAIVRLAEAVQPDAPATAVIEPARWGLIPHWKKDMDGPPLFNARAETVASKPSFREAFKRGRCLIPLDGYYEWKAKGEPYFVSAPEGDGEGAMLWAAGLWTFAQDQLTATMITTEATEEMSWLHGRLPKFLLPEEIQPWLAGDSLLEPSRVRGFQVRPADPAVGNVRNDYAELIAPRA